MKKITAVFVIILVIAINVVSVSAGDVPESVLHDDDARIYFGKLIDAAPLSSDFRTTVEPLKNVKGDIELGTEITYTNPYFVGGFSAKRDCVYLFVQTSGENEVYILKPSSYDTKTLKLTGVSDSEMWSRFAQKLNDGLYEEAEKERCAALGIEVQPGPTDLPPLTSFNMEFWALISIAVSVVAFIIYTKVSKRKL